MNIYPYVYRIDHPSGEFYIGYRCANRVPAEADFGHKYKTSSKHLSYPFEEYTQTILAEFFTDTAKTDALDFEQTLIFENWEDPLLANKSCYYGKAHFKLSGHSADTRHRISETKKKNMSLDTRLKISVARQGKAQSLTHKENMSRSLSGRTLSEEHKKNIANGLRGKPRSEETKRKISESRRRLI